MQTRPPSDAGGVLPGGVLPLQPGDPAVIGGHMLLGRLGTGGMGIVYLGRSRHGMLVAVKAASLGMVDDELVRRFQAEAACLRRAPAGCAARLVDDGTARMPPYIVTEYVEGLSLDNVVGAGGPLPPEQVRALAVGVLRALAAIHAAGMVHRDLKPGNVVLTPTGPRLIDFGIAQQVGHAGGPTAPGRVVGSPGWIPPERLNRQPATPASDVFGWGCLVAYSGTGRSPFGQGDVEELAWRTLHQPPDLAGLDDMMYGPVSEALAKNPMDRPSAVTLLGRLVPEEATAILGVGPGTGVGAESAMGMDPGVDTGTKVLALPTSQPAGHRRRRDARTSKAVPIGVAVTAAAVLTAVIVTAATEHNDPGPALPAGGQPTPSSGNEATVTPTHINRRVHHTTRTAGSGIRQHTVQPKGKYHPGKGGGKGGKGHG